MQVYQPAKPLMLAIPIIAIVVIAACVGCRRIFKREQFPPSGFSLERARISKGKS